MGDCDTYGSREREFDSKGRREIKEKPMRALFFLSTLKNIAARSIEILYNINGDDNEIGMDNKQLYNNI